MSFLSGFETLKFQTKFKELVHNSKSLSRSLTNISLSTSPPQARELHIETPTNVRHQYKAFFNKKTGKIEGLPPHIKALLMQAEAPEGICYI